MTVNQRVRYFRTEIVKMSQRAFAKCIGMKQTSISSLENGSVSSQTIKTLCLAFNFKINKSLVPSSEGLLPILTKVGYNAFVPLV